MEDYNPFKDSHIPESLEPMLGEEDLSATYNRVMADLRSVAGIFSERIEESDLAAAFARGLQWDEGEIKEHLEQRRVPYVFDQISSKIASLQGAHSVLRVEAKALPSEIGDDAKAEIFNRLIKWCDQINRIDQLEDEVFYDTVVEGAAATVVRWDMTDFLSGRPVIERIPLRQMRWDARSVDKERKDARWMARIMYMTRQEAFEELPEYHDDIAGAATVSDDISGIGDDEILTQRQREVAASEEEWENLRAYIRIVEHYERWKYTAYVVVDGLTGKMEEFDTKSKAEEYLKGLLDSYSEIPDVTLLDEDGNDLLVIVPVKKQAIVQTLIIGGTAVSREVTDLPDFPFQICFCYFHNGEYWSYVDLLISPQRFLNRQISNMDEQMGRGLKQFMTVKENLLRKGVTITDVNNERSKTAGSVSVIDHGAIDLKPNSSVQAEIVPAISMAIGHMTDIAGGKNVLGLQENAAESGAAVRARQEAAGLSRLQIFTHLNYWRRQVTEMALWFMKNYLPVGQQLRILGAGGSANYVEIDDDILDTLANTRTDIVITEAVDTDTIRERHYIQLKELFQTLGPAVPADVALAMMLEMSSIPEASKEKIRSSIQSMQAYYKDEELKKQIGEMWLSSAKSVVKSDMKDRLEAQAAVINTGGTTTP